MVQKPEKTDFEERMRETYGMLIHSMHQVAPDEVAPGAIPPAVIGSVMLLSSEDAIEAAMTAPQETKDDPICLWAHGITMGVQMALMVFTDEMAADYCRLLHERMGERFEEPDGTEA